MDAIEILRPAVVLGGWRLVMLLWMFLPRFPELATAGIESQAARATARLRELLPHDVQRVANNYNHLFEQPTLFYAMAVMIVLLEHVDRFHVQCAWAFVILRIFHSCVQATVDIVLARFALFA